LLELINFYYYIWARDYEKRDNDILLREYTSYVKLLYARGYNMCSTVITLTNILGLLLLTSISLVSQTQDSVLLRQLEAGVINKDSVVHELYKQGRISYESLFQSSANYRSQFWIKRGQFIAHLRQQLSNKFALDYLTRNLDTVFIPGNPRNVPLREDSAADFRVLHTRDPHVIEEFVLEATDYRLYRCPSFHGDQKYTLLSTGPREPFIGFDLFSSDTTKPTWLDDFQITRPGGGGAFNFDTLNGGNIIRVEDMSWGMGHIEYHVRFLTVNDGEFIEQFHFIPARTSIEDDAKNHRYLSQIEFADLDNDGYADIIITMTDDILQGDQNPHLLAEIEQATVVNRISTTVTKFLWDNTLFRFFEVD